MTAPPQVAASAPACPPNVLVVEDDPSIRSFLRTTLEQHGFRVTDAEDAVGAHFAWRDRERATLGHGYAAVVLDNRMPWRTPAMPKPHALAFAKLMAGESRVLIFSADAGLAQELAALELGPGVRFLAKPAPPSEVVRELEELFEAVPLQEVPELTSGWRYRVERPAELWRDAAQASDPGALALNVGRKRLRMGVDVEVEAPDGTRTRWMVTPDMRRDAHFEARPLDGRGGA